MNFCHAHKVRFSYPLGMIFIIIIIILILFFWQALLLSLIFFGKQLKKKEDSFIELKMNFFHADKGRFLYLLGILFEFFIWVAPQLFNRIVSPSPSPSPTRWEQWQPTLQGFQLGLTSMDFSWLLWAWPLVTLIGNNRKIGLKEFSGCSIPYSAT